MLTSTVKVGGASGSAGAGTVTEVSVTTANGVSGSVATATTTPAITLTLGAITPSSVTVTGNTKYTAAPGSDLLASGMTISLSANENQAFGDVCYIDSSGQAHLADASVIATASAVVMCADATIAADATGTYLLYGIARQDAWNWTIGGLIYLSITGTSTNTLTQTAPSATDEVVQILGVATHADRMLFMPNLVQVEVV